MAIHYLLEIEMLVTRTLLAAIVVMLSVTMAHAQDDTVTYMHTDGIGSVRILTNENREVVARYDYLPFGELCSPSACGNPASTATTRQFAGQERDTETTLDYFGARYYRGIGGRFITVDPDHVGGDLFDPQSWNAYAYARNNPLRFVDPAGTDYFVSIDNGGSFEFRGDFDRFRGFASGFGVGANSQGGVIYNAAGKRVGTFREIHPNGFDAMVYQAGRIAKPGGDLAVAGLQIVMSPVVPIPMAVAACAAAARSGEGCSGASVAMAAVPGGGSLRLAFKTGHYASRLRTAGVNVNRAEAAVEEVVRSIGPLGPVSGRIKVDGVLLQWNAHILPNGTINIGSIHKVW